tara:strand:+ start:715 stop:1788 length:1074 start_codon:yes stop_codon:yes gene_type:complete
MKNKIVALYSAILILIFTILLSLDFFYKKYIIDLKPGSHYRIYSPQAFGLKEDAYINLLNDILIYDKNKNISNKKKIYQVKNFLVKETASEYTMRGSKSYINFELVTFDNFDPKILESKLNEKYLKSINKVINTLEDNLYLFDYNYLETQYEKVRQNKILQSYDKLVNSKFFKEYPPTDCNDNKTNCLRIYTSYYNYILKQIDLNNNNKNLLELFNFTIEKNSADIIKAFYSNRFLFEKQLFEENQEEISKSKFSFYSKQYEKFINSKFFTNFVQRPENYCRTYRKGCFGNISDHFNTVLFKHQIERENLFKVEFIKKNEKDKYKFSNEVPKILGLSLILTYILFVLTIKFFKRKLK